MAQRKQKWSANGSEQVPLGCLLGQPAEVPHQRVREVSKKIGVSVGKVKAVLAGNPVGLTFEEYERIRKTLLKEG
jgi:hypothetical protein